MIDFKTGARLNPPPAPPASSSPAKTQWVGAQLVIIFDNGVSKMVRLTADEQKDIIDRLLFNRRSGKKDLQLMEVVVLPMQVFIDIHKIVEKAADHDMTAVDDAKKFLTSMNP